MIVEDKILLSIIVPVFNVEKVLNFCVTSIFNQGLDPQDFEVLLINDGSTDGSYNICLQLSEKHPNIRVFTQENAGQSVARNKGIAEARGIYLSFVDSDDYFLSNGLHKILEIALATDSDFIGFKSTRVLSRKIEEFNNNIDILFQGEGMFIISNYHFNNGPWWYIYKKENFSHIYFIPNRLCEDGLFTAELISSIKKGIILSNILYCYVDNPESTVNTKNKTRQTKLRDDMFFVANHFNHLLSKLDCNNEYYSLAYSMLKKRQESYVFFGLIRSLRTHEKAASVMNKINNSVNLYPIKNYDGDNIFVNKFLIKIFNIKLILYILLSINNIIKVIK